MEPARVLSVEYNESALDHIISETAGYPFFHQLWGSHAWETCPKSPITLQHEREATRRAKKEVDEGTFNSRYERLRDYARALAELGSEPAKSSDVAALLSLTVNRADQGRADQEGNGLQPETWIHRIDRAAVRRVHAKKNTGLHAEIRRSKSGSEDIQ